jgi:hypothetical protein
MKFSSHILVISFFLSTRYKRGPRNRQLSLPIFLTFSALFPFMAGRPLPLSHPVAAVLRDAAPFLV